jgi:phosphinothricin acetyltransferase
MTENIKIVPIEYENYPQVQSIYGKGIETGNATFQTTVKSWEDWQSSVLPSTGFAAFDGNRMLGWTALSSVSDRCVYSGVAEVSVYVDLSAQRKGVGRTLLNHVLRQAEDLGIWTVQAGIFPENSASINLHISCGFKIVGTREKLGKLNGTWRDVVLLERRSLHIL